MFDREKNSEQPNPHYFIEIYIAEGETEIEVIWDTRKKTPGTSKWYVSSYTYQYCDVKSHWKLEQNALHNEKMISVR